MVFWMFNCNGITFVWAVWKMIHLLLLTFKDSLFDFNKSFKLSNSLFSLASILPSFVSLITIPIVVDSVMSSA